MKILILIVCLLPIMIMAQEETYYELPNGSILNEKAYKDQIDIFRKKGEVEQETIKTVRRNDSIIHKMRIMIDITDPSIKQNPNNPYAKHIKRIGSQFPIDKFKDSNGKYFSEDYLTGKPTMINFWFTSCPPCIRELPELNKLKEELGDQVNFIAITFNSDEQVETFLKKYDFNFTFINNARPAIKELEVRAFPMNYVLDKSGKILNVYGDISHEYRKVKASLEDLIDTE